jgi:hypothetical protein
MSSTWSYKTGSYAAASTSGFDTFFSARRRQCSACDKFIGEFSLADSFWSLETELIC